MPAWNDITDPANWDRQSVNYSGSMDVDGGFYSILSRICGTNNSQGVDDTDAANVWTWDGTKWNPPTGGGYAVLRYIGATAYSDFRITVRLRSNWVVDDGGYGTISGGGPNYEAIGPGPTEAGTYTTGDEFVLAWGTATPFAGSADGYATAAFAHYQVDGGTVLCGAAFEPVAGCIDADIVKIEGSTGGGFWTDFVGCEEVL